jgi:hypothetical protein
MKRLLSHRVIFLLLCSLLIAVAQPAAAKSGENIDTQWERLTNDKAFGYKDKKEITKQPPPQRSNAFDKMIYAIERFFRSSIGKKIGWVIFFCLLGWALYMIVFNNRTSLLGRTSKKMSDTPATEQADDLDDNWEKLLRQAMAEQNTRLAIRYSYMRLLQLLQQNELIQFRNDKTNYEYYNELKKAEYKQPFRQLTRQYEYAWYGNFHVSDASYNAYMNTYNTLSNLLHR